MKNALVLYLKTDTGHEHMIMGSVFGQEPRVVQMDDYPDFPAFRPESTLLFFNNIDRPGAMTNVLKVLAASQVNVGHLTLARQEQQRPLLGDHEEEELPPQRALGILSLDVPLAQETLREVKALDSIENVRVVTMKPR